MRRKEKELDIEFRTTEEIPVPKKTIDQVIGQERGVEIVKKAAKQRRNVFLLGDPGTGKSMLAMAMAELLPVEELVDILVYPNPKDPNRPLIKAVKAGEGRKIVEKENLETLSAGNHRQTVAFIMFLFMLSIPWVFLRLGWISEMMAAASLVVAGLLGMSIVIGMQLRTFSRSNAPRVIVDNSEKTHAPFVDATGAKAGALLGDVRHDPLQSGGLGTPPHLRVEAGMIHKANKGVLFVDEISTLSPKSQQELLTAMQEKRYSITGQSELSSGAMVHTEPVPCDFVLVAAGNLLDLRKMHPALRSRIRGYGYEVYLNDTMPDTLENRRKLAQFVAQEVVKDGKIPHFTRDAVIAIIIEARKRAGRRGKLTVKLRELGGLVRAAGDIAKSEGAKYVTPEHIEKAKKIARTMEQQIADKYITMKKEYEIFTVSGSRVGKVNGLAVMGDAGLVLPIEAEVSPGMSKSEGKIIATGKLGDIAKEAIQNVSVIIKKCKGTDISKRDIHVQFLQTYEGVEGDSASVSVATALISALENVKIDQSVAMTGSLSVKGEVLPVGGITQKVEAAIDAGIKTVVIPEANKGDVLLSKEQKKRIKVITASNIYEVLDAALVKSRKKKQLLKKIKRILT
ncbi:MAG: ATP-dependent protease LonB [Candidatus Diapherotrites archaeon]|nr:ATP-dependent protease LonB [Candidatus Diapherotrites archaeon]